MNGTTGPLFHRPPAGGATNRTPPLPGFRSGAGADHHFRHQPGHRVASLSGTGAGGPGRDETISALAGDFSFPLQYGYAAVGRVVELGRGVAPAWQGRLVFAFQPHASHFLATPDELLGVPAGPDPRGRGVLPNLETTVTFLMDGQPLMGEQVAIFGQGIVGLLLTALLSRWPLSSLVTLDLYPRRRLLSEDLGAHLSLDPSAPDAPARLAAGLQGGGPYPGADLSYEISGNPAALDQAIEATGFSGRVVIGSWYGCKRSDLNLGGRFHRSRMRLISSQVSSINPELTGRWNKTRRSHTTWQMLAQVQPARFITQRFPIAQAAQAYDLIDRHPEDVVQVILTY